MYLYEIYKAKSLLTGSTPIAILRFPQETISKVMYMIVLESAQCAHVPGVAD
jgi:hypothetical protein